MKEIAGLDAVFADKEASKKATDDLLASLKQKQSPRPRFGGRKSSVRRKA